MKILSVSFIGRLIVAANALALNTPDSTALVAVPTKLEQRQLSDDSLGHGLGSVEDTDLEKRRFGRPPRPLPTELPLVGGLLHREATYGKDIARDADSEIEKRQDTQDLDMDALVPEIEKRDLRKGGLLGKSLVPGLLRRELNDLEDIADDPDLESVKHQDTQDIDMSELTPEPEKRRLRHGGLLGGALGSGLLRREETEPKDVRNILHSDTKKHQDTQDLGMDALTSEPEKRRLRHGGLLGGILKSGVLRREETNSKDILPNSDSDIEERPLGPNPFDVLDYPSKVAGRNEKRQDDDIGDLGDALEQSEEDLLDISLDGSNNKREEHHFETLPCENYSKGPQCPVIRILFDEDDD